MKIQFLTFILNFIICTSSVYSQITVTEIKKRIDTIVEKPPVYDSMENFQYGLNHSDYKQYIGVRLFLPPIGDNYRLKEEGEIVTKQTFFNSPVDSERSQGGYMFYRGSDIGESKNICNKYYIIHEFNFASCNTNCCCGGYLKLLDVETNKNLYYSSHSYPDIGPFILVPYFVKQKQLFDGKTFIVAVPQSIYGKSTFCKFIDAITDKVIEIKPNSKWKCEVTLLKGKTHYENWHIGRFIIDSNAAYTTRYILKNEQNETFILNNISDGHEFYLQLFDSYLKSKSRQKQDDISRVNQEKKDKEKKKIECRNKFGVVKGELIAQGKVKIGMTSEMCKTAWESPWYKSKTTVAGGVFEDWYYGWGKSLHFENGSLVRIEE